MKLKAILILLIIILLIGAIVADAKSKSGGGKSGGSSKSSSSKSSFKTTSIKDTAEKATKTAVVPVATKVAKKKIHIDGDDDDDYNSSIGDDNKTSPSLPAFICIGLLIIAWRTRRTDR